ncbi:hypothetical protein P691DRAFT_689235 [Macrolepiota fuliginosa MF-IS2]|uniref:Endonuclease/exonuclease/phosphatase domain-containing protein n=1 Tax=Macrolepiota fuliginosa MF-IS2 TaxID=1400762 RepID=A0A9P5WY97_9AGAR|nr:hypothetical protein P691DRAFT_689235 [Macrolepiota fuliginosa MF-IS2]
MSSRTILGVRIYSQNICKNNFSTPVLLEWLKESINIIFLQEPPWSCIRSAPSTVSLEGDDVIGAPKHPDWVCMVHLPHLGEQHLRVMAYVHSRLSLMRPAIRPDLIDHRDVQIVSLYSKGEAFYFMNVYSDAQHTAIDLLSREVDRFPALTYMGRDFNIQSTDWDPGAATQPRSAKLLLELASDLGLDLGVPLVPGPTCFPFNGVDRPSVIDLMFVPTREGHALQPNIDLSLRGTSDHAPLVVRVPIVPEHFMVERWAIKKDSKELELFLAEVSIGMGNLQGMPVGSPDQIETVASAMGDIISAAWHHHSSEVKLCLRSKS